MVKKWELSLRCFFIKGTYAYITWLGDSRVYKFSKSKMDFCTTDHSIVQQLSNKMAITSSIYEKYAAIVTRAIMGDEIKEEIPIEVLSIAEGDTFSFMF